MKVLLVNSGENFQESSVAISATHGRPPTKTELRTQHVLVCHPSRTIDSGSFLPGFDRLFRYFVKTTYRTMAAVCRPRCVLLVYALCCVPWHVRGTYVRNIRLGHFACYITTVVALTNLFRRIGFPMPILKFPHFHRLNVLDHRCRCRKQEMPETPAKQLGGTTPTSCCRLILKGMIQQ